MAVNKIFSGRDIINGLAVVGPSVGSGTEKFYDNTSRDLHLDSSSGLAYFTMLNTRYIYHGGAGGSGNWEH